MTSIHAPESQAPTYVQCVKADLFARGLRKLADFLQEHPEFTPREGVHIYHHVEDRDTYERMAAVLDGNDPATPDPDYDIQHRFFGPVGLQIQTGSLARPRGHVHDLFCRNDDGKAEYCPFLDQDVAEPIDDDADPGPTFAHQADTWAEYRGEK